MVYFLIVIKKKDVFLVKKLENIAEEKHKIRKTLKIFLSVFCSSCKGWGSYHLGISEAGVRDTKSRVVFCSLIFVFLLFRGIFFLSFFILADSE